VIYYLRVPLVPLGWFFFSTAVQSGNSLKMTVFLFNSCTSIPSSLWLHITLSLSFEIPLEPLHCVVNLKEIMSKERKKGAKKGEKMKKTFILSTLPITRRNSKVFLIIFRHGTHLRLWWLLLQSVSDFIKGSFWCDPWTAWQFRPTYSEEAGQTAKQLLLYWPD